MADMSSCRPFLRELHLDVFGLLFRKLALDTEIEVCKKEKCFTSLFR